jgi:integrase
MRGSIVKRGHGYSIVLSLGCDPVTGKRIRRWISVPGNKKDAERKLAELLREIDTGAFVSPSKATVADFLKTWLEEYARPNVGGRTFEGYSDIVNNRLIPSLGSLTLTKLTPEHLQKTYSAWLKDGRLDGGGALSPNSVRRYHQCLHRALETAVKRGLVARNVADAVDLPKVGQSEIRILETDEIARILAATKGTFYYDLYFLALYTGMRRSELLGLKWSDVDLILGQISVSRSLHHLRDGSTDIRPPKTTKGKRLIALSPDAFLMLQDYHKRQEALFSELERPLKDNDYVFADRSGSSLLPDRVTRSWVRLMHRLSVPNAPFHCLRHTHASLLLKAGVHPKIVQERLGHASISITLDIYSHIAPGLQEEAAKAFDRTLSTLLEEAAARNHG